MLARLEAISAAAAALSGVAQEATEARLRAVGVVPSVETANDILRHWAKGERHPGEIGDT